MNILLTGGAGYIGSHTAVSLVQQGYGIVLFDNLSNSRIDVVDAIEEITGIKVPLVVGDVRDTELVANTLKQYETKAVVHFAGLKAVGESVEYPLEYYSNNVEGTISLLQAMKNEHVKHLIFSSSATVYGEPEYLPIDESHPTKAINPYGRSKIIVEEILQDLVVSDDQWGIGCLRYFNPVGAHDSGVIGENPTDIPNNLMPYITRVADGALPSLSIYGDDYETPDGTGVRDYIHVEDLADGHVAALGFVLNNTGFHPINLGTGRGYSVLDIVNTFIAKTGKKVPYEFVNRRKGDVSSCYADVSNAFKILGWKSKRDINKMCISAWNYQQKQKGRR